MYKLTLSSRPLTDLRFCAYIFNRLVLVSSNMQEFVSSFIQEQNFVANMFPIARPLFSADEYAIVTAALTIHATNLAEFAYYKQNASSLPKHELPVYFFEGHGGEGREKDYKPESRPTVPDSTTLVTSKRYDEFVSMDVTCYNLYHFLSTEDLYRDYFQNISSTFFGDSVRVYEAGARMPDLVYSPVMHYAEIPDKVYFSGVQKQTRMFTLKQYGFQDISKCAFSDVPKTFPFAVTTVFDMFQNSAYPSAWEVLLFFGRYRRSHYGAPTLDTINREFNNTVENVMREIGPGIYYFLLCRSCLRSTPAAVYEKYKGKLGAGHVNPGIGTGMLELDEEWGMVGDTFQRVPKVVAKVNKHLAKRDLIRADSDHYQAQRSGPSSAARFQPRTGSFSSGATTVSPESRSRSSSVSSVFDDSAFIPAVSLPYVPFVAPSGASSSASSYVWDLYSPPKSPEDEGISEDSPPAERALKQQRMMDGSLGGRTRARPRKKSRSRSRRKRSRSVRKTRKSPLVPRSPRRK